MMFHACKAVRTIFTQVIKCRMEITCSQKSGRGFQSPIRLAHPRIEIIKNLGHILHTGPRELKINATRNYAELRIIAKFCEPIKLTL